MYIRHYGPSVSCKGLLLFMSRAIFKLHAPTDQTLKDMKTGGGGGGGARVRAMGIRAISLNR